MLHAFAALLVAVLTASAAFALVAGPGSAGAAGSPFIASDSMRRTVPAGLGKADVGGSYTVSSRSHTSVKSGAGHFSWIVPGGSVVARLDRAKGSNVTAALTFAVPAKPSAGNGLYIYEELRRQPNGDAYAIKARIQDNERVSVAFSRFRGGREIALGTERAVFVARPGEVVTLQGQVTGTARVTLSGAVWVGAGTANSAGAWQHQYTDASAARLSSAGSLALMAYQSRGAKSTTALSIKRYQAWPTPARSLLGRPSSPPTVSAPPTRTSAPAPAPSSSKPSGTSGSSGSTTSAGPSSPPPTSTPPGGTGTTAGSAAPGTTAYPIPSGAIFVSPSGSDSAAGTQAAPLRTLTRAVAVAASGSTIVLRAGTYNESVTVQSNKTLTIQSYPHEAVWLDGSIPVSSWTQQGSTWVHTGWTAQFDSTPSYTSTVPTGQYFTFVNPAYPMAAHPDQVWIDGTPLNQVASASAVGPGDFYADYTNDQLVIGSNPAGQQVRASNLSVALTAYSPHFVLRGIGVRDYATSIGQVGAVRLDGPGAVVENVVSQDNATTGLDAQSTGISVRNVTLQGNGMLGIVGHWADNLSITGLLSQGNNTQHFNYAPVSGGLKITSSRGITVTDSAFLGNLGTGVWFDESCYDVALTGSQVRNNLANGVSDEISSTGLIANNTIDGNGQIGLKINNTNDVRAWNNTITNNNSEIQIVEDSRRASNLSTPGHDTRQQLPDPTEPWIASNDALMNNVLGPVPSGSAVVIVRDYSGQYSAAQLNAQLSGNAFAGPVGGPVVIWGTGGSGATSYTSVAGFQSGTGQSGNTAPSSLDQVAVNSGQPLPADVAAAIGEQAGGRHVGAF